MSSPQDLMAPFVYTFSNAGPKTIPKGLSDNASKAMRVILKKMRVIFLRFWSSNAGHV